MPNVARPGRARVRGPGVEMLGTELSPPFHRIPAAPDTSSGVRPARVWEGVGLRWCGAFRVARPAPALTQQLSSVSHRGRQRSARARTGLSCPCPAWLGSPRPRPPHSPRPISAAPPPAGSRGLRAPQDTSGFASPVQSHVTDGRREGVRVRTPAGAGPATAAGSAAAAGSPSLCSEGPSG